MESDAFSVADTVNVKVVALLITRFSGVWVKLM